MGSAFACCSVVIGVSTEIGLGSHVILIGVEV